MPDGWIATRDDQREDVASRLRIRAMSSMDRRFVEGGEGQSDVENLFDFREYLNRQQ